MQRRCNACRTAKTQCDLARPKCTRCTRREIECVYPSSNRFEFRSQNEVAAENVRRARQPRSRAVVVPVRLAFPVASSSQSMSVDESLFQYNPTPWLSQEAFRLVPPVLYSVRDKATIRFYAKWVLHPCNHNICPGYFHFLPAMMTNQPEDGILKLAVNAAAFAEVADSDREGAFAVKSQQNYGAALAQIRRALQDVQAAVNDNTLAAILVIDTFELVYMTRYEPLGRHAEGVIQLLRMRGIEQLFTQRGLDLWRLVHHRLQARQLLLGTEPIPESQRWLEMLSPFRPDFHIAKDALRIIQATADARKVLNLIDPNLAQTNTMIQDLETLDRECSMWLENVEFKWLPQLKELDPQALQNTGLPVTLPQSVLVYHDLWTARTWNYHRNCRIKLQEMIMLLKTRAKDTLAPDEIDIAEAGDDLERHQDILNRLSDEILCTVPTLLGLVDSQGHLNHDDSESKEVGLLFMLLPMWIIQRCAHTTEAHKTQATSIMEFVNWKMRRF